MNKQLLFIVIAFSGLLFFAEGSIATSKTKAKPSTDDLGWTADAHSACNLCGGYYKELPILYEPNPLVASQKDNFNIEGNEGIYSLKGVSILKGGVQVTQQDTQLNANLAKIYRNRETGAAEHIDAFGDVRLLQPDRLLVAKQGSIEVQSKNIVLHDVNYRVALKKSDATLVKDPKTGKYEKHLCQMNARGSAKVAEQVKPNLIRLKQATYTTCSPSCDTWAVHASTVHLNRDSGRGDAINSALFLKKIPVFYTPYISFPIDDRRKTGFLLPEMGYDENSGISFKAPFYLNLAPNYDATIAPNWMSNRGVQWLGEGRYLTERNHGNFGISYLPSDREFRSFQKTSARDYPTNANLSRLVNANDNRSALTWKDHMQFNNRWSGDVDWSGVSDDYYVRDFSSDIMDATNSQLLQQGKVNYYGDHWNFLGNLQHYRTLHTVNQDASNQYAKLPQLQLNGDYANLPIEFGAGINTEFVRFSKTQDPGQPKPVIGDRTSIRPNLRLPLERPFGFITPEAKIQLSQYSLRHTPNNKPDNPSLTAPIFDVKSGLYFDREVHFGDNMYQQTLEPVLYYLYVPNRSQSDIPVFDTNLQSFSYDLMFQDNRFSGVDRIGDANQLTLALTSRLINESTGDEKARFGIGQIRYFRDRNITLDYDNATSTTLNSTDTRASSPIAGTITYNVIQSVSLTAGFAWNTYMNNFDNDDIGLTYQHDPYRLINVSYHFTRGGDTLAGAPTGSPDNDLKQTDISSAWKLTDRWSFLGRWNYNWSHHHVQAYFYGLMYDSCCWAVRFLSGQTFEGYDPNNVNRQYSDYKYEYKNVFYVQFALKGLGDFGNANPTSFLAQNITHYVDRFGEIT